MKLVTLIRHAKALPQDPNNDAARALSSVGREAAIRIGEELRDKPPDLVLCSPSLRTRETLEFALPRSAHPAEVLFEEELYLAHASSLAKRIGELPSPIKTAWLIGHNPGIHDLVRQFCELAGTHARTQPVYRHYPPASYATFRFDAADWGMIDDAPCVLVSASGA